MSGECFCLSGFIGQPPHCHRECESNSECPETKVCIEQRCRDPCDGYCGLNTDCFVRNDQPVCICRKGYTGDPYEMCSANLTQTVVEKNENRKFFTVDYYSHISINRKSNILRFIIGFFFLKFSAVICVAKMQFVPSRAMKWNVIVPMA